MSLEDGADPPPSVYELGDKVFTLPPNKANLFMSFPAEDVFIMNDHKDSLYYYVESIPPNPVPPETRGLTIVHIFPISRRDELAPESVETR